MKAVPVLGNPRPEASTKKRPHVSGFEPRLDKRIFRFQMLPLDQRNLLIICGRNFIYNNTAGSNGFYGLAHGPARHESESM